MIYVISDTHFNHKNIITYENRPFKNVDEMNHNLIKNWNSIVNDDDIVIHLGDVGLGNESTLKSIIPILKGYKILIKGNHDSKSSKFYLECGFNEIYSTYFQEFNGLKIFMSHRPLSKPGNGEPYDLHLYGHVHSKGIDRDFPTISKNGACLCVERWNYQPVPLDKIVNLCKECKETNGIL